MSRRGEAADFTILETPSVAPPVVSVIEGAGDRVSTVVEVTEPSRTKHGGIGGAGEQGLTTCRPGARKVSERAWSPYGFPNVFDPEFQRFLQIFNT